VTQFLAPTFSLDVPDDAIDASNYAFVLPNGTDSPPTVAILVHPAQAVPDLEALVDTSLADFRESAEDPIIHQRLVTTRGSWHYAMTIVESGPPEMRLTQKTVTLYVVGDEIRRYTIIGTARTEYFPDANVKFDAITQSFKPA